MRASNFLSLGALTVVSACGTQIGDEGKLRGTPTGACVADSTAIDLEYVTPLGFTAASVVEGVQGARNSTLSYDETGLTTALTVEVIADGDARWVEETWVPAEGADPAAEPWPCAAWVEIDGTTRFETQDGAFAERLPSVIIAETEAGVGRFFQQVAYADLVGTYEPTGITLAEWDEAHLEWGGGVNAENIAGELALFAYQLNPDGSVHEEWSAAVARFHTP